MKVAKDKDGGSYTQKQWIWWAINQMRRAARTIDLISVGATLQRKNNYYSPGLDDCANTGEQFLKRKGYRRKCKKNI